SQCDAHASHPRWDGRPVGLAEAVAKLVAPLGVPAAAIGELVAPAVCWSCADFAGRGRALCGRCRASLHRLGPDPVLLAGVRVWAPVAYSGPARDLVRALKFRGAIHVADSMAAQIVANAPEGLLARDS